MFSVETDFVCVKDGWKIKYLLINIVTEIKKKRCKKQNIKMRFHKFVSYLLSYC